MVMIYESTQSYVFRSIMNSFASQKDIDQNTSLSRKYIFLKVVDFYFKVWLDFIQTMSLKLIIDFSKSS